MFAGLVLHRSLKNRRSPLELWYAAAFLTFALSDFREAWVQQSWLIWWKLINLIALFSLRRAVIERFYPSSKVF